MALLSKKAQRSHEKEREPFMQPQILSEDDPRMGEAIERLGMLDMDEMYAERQLQAAFQEIVEQDINPTKYSAKDRLRAAMAYLVTGSTIKAGDMVGIPHNTIRSWKAKASWWPTALEYAKQAKKEETSARLGALQDKAMEVLQDNLENGEEVVLKTGDKVRKQVNAKDAMWIVAQAQDKKMVLNGEATKITEQRTQADVLNDVAKKLEAIVLAADAKVLEGIVIEKSSK